MNKNYLIITLGTREIQVVKSAIEPNGFEVITEIKKETLFTYVQPVGQPELRISARRSDDFPDFYTISPRLDGNKINDNFSLFRPILDWPLIRPALAHLKENGVQLDIIMLIYTDQEEALAAGRVKKKSYIDNDTVFFADLIENLIREDSYFDTAKIDPFGRSESVADIGVQYEEFRKIKDYLISDDDVDKVYLFPQGGIDQINQALTLRLIETFEGRVVYLQSAEGHTVQELNFPALFVRNLIRGKAEPALKRYEFSTLETLVDDPTLKYLAHLGVVMQSLDVSRVKSAFADLFLTGFESITLQESYNRINSQSEDLTKQELLFLNALTQLESGNYNEATWRLRTLGEILLAPNAKEYLSLTNLSNSNEFTAGILSNTNLMSHFTKKVVQTNGKWQANAYALRIIFDFRYGKNKPQPLDKVARLLETVGDIRNDLVHSAKPVSKSDLDNALAQRNQTLESVDTNLRAYFRSIGIVINNKGIYDTIRDEIRSLL